MAYASLAEVKLSKLRRLQQLQEELARMESTEANQGKYTWKDIARPDQLAPPGDWFTWLILAGRGWGKTRTAAEWALDRARRYPGARIALVGKTFADVRDTIIEGESGIISLIRREEFRDGTEDRGYNRSLSEIFLENGSRFKSFSAEKPWRLRGPQHHFAIADEAAFWQDASKGIVADTTWSNLVITLRLPKQPDWDEDYRPQVVVATTPRPVPLLKVSDPDANRTGLMQRETTIITRGRTVDNLENLSKTYQANVIAPLLGTRLGRQELDAELLEDNPGAMWRREWIDETRIDPNAVPDLIRVVVGVDPAVTDGETSAQTGIIVAGADRRGQGYILADFTMRGTPRESMQRVVRAYKEFNADRVIGEVNNGGDYIGMLLHTVDQDVPFQKVTATRAKQIRAEPVSSLYEQRRIHHAGSFPYLEDSQCVAQGTLVTTRRGNIPVEQVSVADYVFTRDGWKQVLWSGFTGIKQVVRIQTDAGSLICTPNHPIFTEKSGFIRADNLSSGDRIIRCQWNQSGRSLFTGGKNTTGVAVKTLPENTTGNPDHEAELRSIVTSGKMLMGLFPRDSSFTISTTTQQITKSVISKLSASQIIRSIIKRPGQPECMPSAAKIRVSSILSGGNAGNHEQSSASSAMSYSIRLESGLPSVLVNVQSATVLSVPESMGQRCVYNLTVDHQPEFFANGLLTHNCQWTPLDKESPDRLDACVWAIWALRDLISGGYLDAYGVRRCENCNNAYLITENGKPRTHCPNCRQPITEERKDAA